MVARFLLLRKNVAAVAFMFPAACTVGRLCLSAKKGVNQFTLATHRPSQRCFAFLYLFLRIRYWSSSSLTQQALSLVSLYITIRVTEKV